MRCKWVLVLSAWPLGCDLSSLTLHIPISPEAGSILTSPLLRNINGASATAPDSLQAANALRPWGWGKGHTGSASFLSKNGGGETRLPSLERDCP